MLKKMIIGLSASICLITNAETSADAAHSTIGDLEKAPVTHVQNVNDSLQKIRNKSRLQKKGFVGIGIADIGAEPQSSQYILNRTMAFAIAELNAKKAIVKNMQSKISTAIKNLRKSNSAGLSSKDFDGDEDLTKAVNQVLTASLQEKGVDLTDVEAVKKALPKIVENQNFKKSIELTAQAFLSGLSVYASEATNTQVGVLVYSSATLREIAKGMVTGTIKKYNNPGQDPFDLVDSMTPEQLSGAYGTRVIIDNNGDPCILAFAQMPVIGSEDSSLEMADDAASALIREFAGTSMAINNAITQQRVISYLQDDDNPNSKAVANAVLTARQEAESYAEALDFSGITECKNGILQAPSGDKIAYSVKYWTPTAAREAAKMYEEGKQQEKAVKNNKGVRGGDAPKTADKQPSKRKNIGINSEVFTVEAL